MDSIIRKIRPSEIPLLSDFLYEAIFVPAGSAPPPRDIIQKPELQVYLTDFGKRKDDICFVAQVDQARIMNDYGHIDDQTPSLSISIFKEYRGRGIGTALMKTMLKELKDRGYQQVSLSVQKANYAVRMYEKAGFEVVEEKGEEYIMVCKLGGQA